MELMAIGAFAERSRLSPKALRLYDRLGLLSPATVDPVSGYRLYAEDQIERARLIGLLRRVDMPLATIADTLTRSPAQASSMVEEYWSSVETVTAERRALVAYIQARLTGAHPPEFTVETRSIARRTLATVSRHVHASETDTFFSDAFARLRATGPGLEGVAGLPFLIFYGEVSDDSDGPIELCRPIATPGSDEPGFQSRGLEARVEPAHDEAFIRLALKQMGWPALLGAYEALQAWSSEHGRQPNGPPRQVLIADQRTATPDTLVCDLSLPLKP
jgi:DNA-binding transcriptional MerR regulator